MDIVTSDDTETRWTRQDPFIATISAATRMSGPASQKSVHHIEVDLADSGIEYHPGDSLGLDPVNPTDPVPAILEPLAVLHDAPIPGRAADWGVLFHHLPGLPLPTTHPPPREAAQRGACA